MNRNLDRRLRKLEQASLRHADKPILPEWLSETWEKECGLPFDTPENVWDSLQRLQERDKPIWPRDDGHDDHQKP
jgi:hypothetical protein